MFDEQPDGDPHGECVEEIHRLGKEVSELRAANNQWLEGANTLTPTPQLFAAASALGRF